jgi:CRP-like cAMP-binding protein
MKTPTERNRAIQNKLLASLPATEYDRLAPHLHTITLEVGQILKDADEAANDAYFPLDSVISLITLMENGMTIESGVVGREGVAGLSTFLGGGPTPNQHIVQAPGEALKIRGKKLAEEFSRGGTLQQLLHRFVLATIVQISQSAACNRIHSTEERLCRWLLMMKDRVDSGYFPHTQEFLSRMLGAARPIVTLTAGALQKAGWIKYSRGNITILDRHGLESATCECYAKVRSECDRLLGPN